MKKIFYVVLSACIVMLISCAKSNDNSLNVYCYDSFVGDWGPGSEIAKEFEEETGIHVELISCSGSVQLYSKIIYEGKDCTADVVIGLPDSINIDSTLFSAWNPKCKNDLIDHDSDTLIPFNYGVFAFIYDSESDVDAPKSLKDLANPKYKDKFIIIDPRTSSVGLGLLKWSYYALGDKFESWWKTILDNALTVADSWSSAYGLFTEGEAPIVISYSTSPVYHLMYDKTDRYKALSFEEGHIKTEEYLAIMKNSKKQKEAELFCNFVLTKGQSSIAVANTMYPANKNTELPVEYNSLIEPEIIDLDNKDFLNIQEELIKQWTRIATK